MMDIPMAEPPMQVKIRMKFAISWAWHRSTIRQIIRNQSSPLLANNFHTPLEDISAARRQTCCSADFTDLILKKVTQIYMLYICSRGKSENKNMYAGTIIPQTTLNRVCYEHLADDLQKNKTCSEYSWNLLSNHNTKANFIWRWQTFW
jgi:hypothetical protein